MKLTPSAVHVTRARRGRTRFPIAMLSALALLLGFASPAAAVSGSISGSSACRAGYASTSSTFAPSAAQYALTVRPAYFAYNGALIGYGSFHSFGSTVAHYKRTAYSSWYKFGVSDVYWTWWAGTPDTGLTLLNHIHVDCNT